MGILNTNSQERVWIGVESQFGVIPSYSASNLLELPITSFQLQLNQDSPSSAERSGSRRRRLSTPTNRSISGSMSVRARIPKPGDAYELLWKHGLRGTVNTVNMAAATTISIATSAGVTTLGDTGSGFVTAGIRVGDHLKIVSTTPSATIYGAVLTVAAGTVTIRNADDSADQSAGAAVTITGNTIGDSDQDTSLFIQHYLGLVDKVNPITGTTFDLAGASLTDSADGFGKVLVGDTLEITTPAGTKTANVSAKTDDGDLTLDDAGAGADAASGALFTIKVKRHVYYRYSGVIVSQFSLSAQENNEMTMDFTLMGQDKTESLSALGAGTDYAGGNILRSGRHAPPASWWVHPKDGQGIQSYQLQVGNNSQSAMDVHYQDPVCIYDQALDVQFTGSAYFKDPVQYAKWLNFQSQQIYYELVDDDGVVMYVQIFNTQPMPHNIPDAGDRQPLMYNFGFMGGIGEGDADDYVIKISYHAA